MSTVAQKYAAEGMLVKDYGDKMVIDRRPMRGKYTRKPYQILTNNEEFVGEFKSLRDALATV